MHWIFHLDGGPRRVNHAAVIVKDKIYSFGGYCVGIYSQQILPMDVHVLNTWNYRWVLLPSNLDSDCIPYQRYGHSAVAYENKIYIWGGQNDNVTCNILYCFDVETQSWSKPQVSGSVPTARDGHTACVIGHRMYIFGGYEGEQKRFTQDLFVLDFQTMVWSFLNTYGEPPSFRDFHTATAFNDRMYIFGGRGDISNPFSQEFYCPNIMYLDTKTNQWHRPTTSGARPCGRRSHSAFVHNNYIYIFGGYNGIIDRHSNDLFRFCPLKNEWKLLKPLGLNPCARRRQACIMYKNKMFMFGGTSPQREGDHEEGLQYHDDLYILDFDTLLQTLCMITVINYKLNYDILPITLKWQIKSMTTPNNIGRTITPTG